MDPFSRAMRYARLRKTYGEHLTNAELDHLDGKDSELAARSPQRSHINPFLGDHEKSGNVSDVMPTLISSTYPDFNVEQTPRSIPFLSNRQRVEFPTTDYNQPCETSHDLKGAAKSGRHYWQPDRLPVQLDGSRSLTVDDCLRPELPTFGVQKHSESTSRGRRSKSPARIYDSRPPWAASSAPASCRRSRTRSPKRETSSPQGTPIQRLKEMFEAPARIPSQEVRVAQMAIPHSQPSEDSALSPNQQIRTLQHQLNELKEEVRQRAKEQEAKDEARAREQEAKDEARAREQEAKDEARAREQENKDKARKEEFQSLISQLRSHLQEHIQRNDAQHQRFKFEAQQLKLEEGRKTFNILKDDALAALEELAAEPYNQLKKDCQGILDFCKWANQDPTANKSMSISLRMVFIGFRYELKDQVTGDGVFHKLIREFREQMDKIHRQSERETKPEQIPILQKQIEKIFEVFKAKLPETVASARRKFAPVLRAVMEPSQPLIRQDPKDLEAWQAQIEICKIPTDWEMPAETPSEP